MFAAALGTRQIESLSLASVALLPLLAGTLAGLLVALEKLGPGAEQKDVQQLQGLAEEGRRLVIYDRETGLYAYWYFSLRLQEEMARSDRRREPFTLMLVEATRGRVSQDEERHLFACMQDGFRKTDLVAHLGNLRFVALLPNTSRDQAEAASRRMKGLLGDDEVRLGIACYPEDGKDWASLLQTAESYPQAA
jgi:GGDEF domain-containing protein